MKLNKNVLVVLLLLSIFVVGTIAFSDTVSAAKWKKYDSGSFNVKKPGPGFKNKFSYVTYIKGSKNIKMNMYMYFTKNNKKIYAATFYMSKTTGKTLKLYSVDLTGKKSKVEYYSYKGNVKSYYKGVKKRMES